MEACRIFRSVKPLPGYRLDIEMETGSSVCFDFNSRLESVRFGALRDKEVFASAATDGLHLLFYKDGKEQVRIPHKTFLDLLIVDRTRLHV